MTPPHIADGEGFPFKLLGRVPYRPDGFTDWREGILAGLIERHFFALTQTGAPVPQHIGAVPNGDGVVAKS